MEKRTAEKRVVKSESGSAAEIRSLILTAVLLAAGAVLKFFAGSVINIGGMKPNFIIAMYCLAILLIRPSLPRAAVIGVLAGAVCQFFPGTPYINFISEILGAVVMALLIRIPMQRNISSVVSTFLATLVSGGVYTVSLFAFTGAAVETLAAYVPIVLCTALINCVIVGVLYVPARGAQGVSQGGGGMIEIRGLSFRYAGESRDALHNIDMTVEDGDFIGVTGPSGAGKTTLTQALSGLVPHRRAGDFFGSVTVNGVDTVDSSLTALALQVGSVFQDIDSQMVAGQVEDEILFGLENFGVDRAEIPRRIDEALDDVGVAPLRHRAIDSLSGGQKQKVAIAAILALRPKILVLDEPTGELDPGASEQIFRLLRRMNEAHGMTVIVVEQKIMLLSAYAKKLAVLNDGQLELFGPVREVLRHSARLEAIGVHCPRVVTLSNRLADLTGGALATDLDEAEILVREVLA